MTFLTQLAFTLIIGFFIARFLIRAIHPDISKISDTTAILFGLYVLATVASIVVAAINLIWIQ